MVDKKKSKAKDVAFRAVKAAAKAAIVCLLYLFLTPLLASIREFNPEFMSATETFVVVFIVLMILGDLTARTIFQCFFSAARSLFVITYLIFSLQSGVISVAFENFSLTVNLTMLYAIAVLLSLLGFARSLMQAINFMGERAEGSIQP
jgi:uncharacterized ion transporter superfamily protein YfcC